MEGPWDGNFIENGEDVRKGYRKVVQDRVGQKRRFNDFRRPDDYRGERSESR